MIKREGAGAVQLIRTRLQTLRARRMQMKLEVLLIASGSHIRRPDGLPGVWAAPKSERQLCGAKTRKGTPCKAPCVANRTRCRMHGGLSTGAKTDAGRAAIVASNQRRGQEYRARKLAPLEKVGKENQG